MTKMLDFKFNVMQLPTSQIKIWCCSLSSMALKRFGSILANCLSSLLLFANINKSHKRHLLKIVVTWIAETRDSKKTLELLLKASRLLTWVTMGRSPSCVALVFDPEKGKLFTVVVLNGQVHYKNSRSNIERVSINLNENTWTHDETQGTNYY